jgi:saccharopine dehydrogenase-like NADP-dependent oxidoreductase
VLVDEIGGGVKVLIVGAGEQGYVLTWNLVKHPRIDEVVVADWDEARAREVVARVGAGKATAVKVDARDVDAVAGLANGAELLINAVIPEWDEPLMNAALKAKCHYQDMATRTEGGTVDDGFLMQMEMDEDFKAIDRTALIHCGMTPGVTNTLAAIGYEELDHCEEIRIKGGGCFKSEVPLQVWSQETYYIDSQTSTLYFDEGVFKRAEPFDGWEYYDFPAPVGRTPVTFHEHEECSTLPRFLPANYGDKGLRHLEFKLGGTEESLKKAEMIVKMGFASPELIDVRGTKIRPIDLLVTLLPPTTPRDVIATMASEGRITDEGVYAIELWRNAGEMPAESFFVFPPNIQWVNDQLPGANRVSYGTSTPAAIHAEFLLDGKIVERGIVPPEAVSREVRLEYVEELKRRGLRIVRQSARWL